MKKLTFLFVACSMALMSYAAGGNITYELNGGVTNTHGWQNKNDMYMGLNTAWNTFSATTKTWTSLDALIVANGSAVNAVPKGIPTEAGANLKLTFIQDAAVKAEWQWLVDYMDAACVAQGKALATSDAAGSPLRYNLSAFFLSSVRSSYPVSPDYSLLGQPEAFIPAWKHAFAGPATYDGTGEVVIPSPYKQGFTFDGWYDNAGFTGTKLSSIAAGTTGDKTLYAKWIEYIPTCKEVVALGAAKATKAGGIVTFIDGKTVYLQDASGGLKVEFTATPDFAVGNKITLSGTTTALGTYIKVTGAVSLSKETAILPAFQTITIPTLKADPAAYMFEYVSLEGLLIKSHGSGNVVLTDGVNDITLVATLNQSQLPINTIVNLKAIVSFDTQVVLVGEASKVSVAPVPRPDTAVYPSLEDGKYTLTSRWMVSNQMDNFSANRIGTPDFVRGMTAKDGKMYFANRSLEQLDVVDGANGKKLAPIKMDTANIFKHNGVKVGYPYNDIKQDAAGNILVSNLMTSISGPFQVWKIDLATGKGIKIIDELFKDNPDYAAATIRFDAFGVWGDVNGKAIIMAANASAMEAYKWTITNGVVGEVEQILIPTTAAGTFMTGITTPGTAPQIFPLDEDYFYLDGWDTLPTLIDMNGTIVDGFYNVPKEVEDWSVNIGNRKGHNGLIEFELAGEYFFLMASMNTAGSPPSTFRLFKWANANKEFAAIKSMWTLPEAGMGTASNSYRTAVPSVEVNNVTKVATLYLYTGENGYGVYEFKNNAPNSVKTVNNSAVSIFVNNRTLELSKEVASVTVYSVAGQLIAKANNVTSLNLKSNGVYLVKATTLEGETAIHKVIVK